MTEGAQSLRRHGTSFAFAARLLPAETARTVSRLYGLCRAVDDLADEDGEGDGASRLARMRTEMTVGAPRDPLARGFVELARTTAMPLAPAVTLVDGVRRDLVPMRVQTVGELLVYAYRVAGTVGEMMAPILGARDDDATARAVDLGIAMQLTNIARDVAADAALGRRYLPAEWVDLAPGAIATPTPSAREAVPPAVLATLALAERYYASGLDGLPYLPFRSRVTVAVAAALYRAIRDEIAACDGAYWRGRAVVARPRRLRVAARTLARSLASAATAPGQPDPETGLVR